MRKAKVVWHKDDDAVSPVIGTILMVAITVVLAAVLWLMVSGMIQDPEDEKLTIQLSSPKVSQYERPVAVPPALPTYVWDAVLNINKMTPKDEKVKWSEVRIAIKGSDGSILKQSEAPLEDGSATYDVAGIVEFWYVDITLNDVKVGAGDSIKITGMSDTLYEGATVQLLKGGKIIGTTTLPTDFP